MLYRDDKTHLWMTSVTAFLLLYSMVGFDVAAADSTTADAADMRCIGEKGDKVSK